MLQYLGITMEMTIAIKVRDVSLSNCIHLEKTEVCSKTLKIQPPCHITFYMSQHLTSILTFICFYLLSASPFEPWNVLRICSAVFSLEYSECSLSLLTVDNHIDVFDIRRGDIVAGLAFVTTRLVSHDTYNIQVLFSFQWLCCREERAGSDWERQEGQRERQKKEIWALFQRVTFPSDSKPE